MSDVEAIRRQYRQLALQWAEARNNPPVANRIFKAHHALFKKIRGEEAGREVIRSLLTDESEPVLILAATHALTFEPDAAESVLERLSKAQGQYAIDAKYTLRAYRTGTLDLDW